MRKENYSINHGLTKVTPEDAKDKNDGKCNKYLIFHNSTISEPTKNRLNQL